MAASTSTHLATVLVVSALASAAPPVTIAVNHTTGMTLAAAAGEVAAALRRASSDIVVRLAPGEHLVPAGGLRLGPEHTPAEARHTVTWQGAGAASVSSACNVTGWAPAPASAGFPAGTVAAPAPAALGGAVVRHLWVDGVRAPRTRRALGAALSGGSLALQPDGAAGYPLGYMATAAGGGGGGQDCAADYGKDTPCCGQPAGPGTTVKKQYQCPAGAPACTGYVFDSHWGHCSGAAPNGTALHLGWGSPADVANVEFVYSGVAQGWSEARCAVESLSGDGTAAVRLTMKQPCFYNLVNRMFQPVHGAPPKFVDNVRAHLDTPGQFYHDAGEGTLYYLPLPGQATGAASRAVVALEQTLLTHAQSAQHVWEGVAFEYATWLRPGQGGGFVEQQSAACDLCAAGTVLPAVGCGANDTYVVTPANVLLEGARDVTFKGCAFRHLGAYGAGALGGSQRVSWEGCSFADVSAGALMLGDITDAVLNETDRGKWDADLSVTDCDILNLPVEYTGATGLFAGYVAGLTVAHNLFANQTYSAMTIGWGWGRTGSGRGGNAIVGNRVERPTTVRCCDGGGIYTLGPQPNSSLSRNYIVDDRPPLGGSNCIYHDNGSGGFVDSENVCDGSWSHAWSFNRALGRFGACGACPVAGQPVGGNCSMSFHGNFLRTSGGIDSGKGCADVHQFDNARIGAADPLPAAAAQIASEAGPRPGNVPFAWA